MLKRVAALAIGLGLVASLAGCVSYDEVYGKITAKEQKSVSSFTTVGKVMVPTTTTYYYLTVKYSGPNGDTVSEQWSVTSTNYLTCLQDAYIFREENGAITCSVESFR